MVDGLSSSTLLDSDADERTVAAAALEASEEKLRALCASHAGTFVSVERRGAALEASLQELLNSTKGVLVEVEISQHALDQEAGDEVSLSALSEKHRVRRRTLLQHSSLLELLELPSLMDACVRSSLYDEALSIAAFANTLERRHTEKNEVVLKVISQVRSRQSDLSRHLLQCLKSHVTMPECLEIVTALRRLNSIDLERHSEKNLERVHAAMELSLQVDFLEARDAWLDQPFKSMAMSGLVKSGSIKSRSHAPEQLLDTIERYRTRMFEIATQFNAIFRSHVDGSETSHSLLSMWTSRRIRSFLDILALELGTVEDAGSVRDTLDACVFFSASMGRLGADFTPLLPAVFEARMLDIVVQHWNDGLSQLSETLKVCREAGVASPLSSSTTIAASMVQDGSGTENSLMPPPRQLMAVPPLGRLVNAYLTGINELRRCLLPRLFAMLRKSLDESLSELGEILQLNERTLMTPGIRGDSVTLRTKAKEMRQMMVDVIVPYIRGALEASFGNTVTAHEFQAALLETLNLPLGEAAEGTNQGDNNIDTHEEQDLSVRRESGSDKNAANDPTSRDGANTANETVSATPSMDERNNGLVP